MKFGHKAAVKNQGSHDNWLDIENASRSSERDKIIESRNERINGFLWTFFAYMMQYPYLMTKLYALFKQREWWWWLLLGFRIKGKGEYGIYISIIHYP